MVGTPIFFVLLISSIKINITKSKQSQFCFFNHNKKALSYKRKPQLAAIRLEVNWKIPSENNYRKNYSE